MSPNMGVNPFFLGVNSFLLLGNHQRFRSDLRSTWPAGFLPFFDKLFHLFFGYFIFIIEPSTSHLIKYSPIIRIVFPFTVAAQPLQLVYIKEADFFVTIRTPIYLVDAFCTAKPKILPLCSRHKSTPLTESL